MKLILIEVEDNLFKLVEPEQIPKGTRIYLGARKLDDKGRITIPLVIEEFFPKKYTIYVQDGELYIDGR